MIMEKENYTISSERKHVDVDALHDKLRSSYWTRDRSREVVEKPYNSFHLFILSYFYQKKECC